MDSLLKLQGHSIPSAGRNNNTENSAELSRRVAPNLASWLSDAKLHAVHDASDAGDEGVAPTFAPATVGQLTLNGASMKKCTQSMAGSLLSAHQITQSLTEVSPCVEQLNSVSGTHTFSDTTSSKLAVKVKPLEKWVAKGSIACPGAAVLPALMTKVSDVECLLHTMLPPKITVKKDTGETFAQFVSSESSSRDEVAELHERLIQRLRQRRARDTGICPIRREIYADVFDELIRQITLEEPARGILLLRVRDELYQTLAAHHSLVEQVTCFASKKRSQSMENMHHFSCRIKELAEERSKLLLQLKRVEVRQEQILSAIEEENIAREKVRQNELNYYRQANRQLSQRIKAETERAGTHGVDVSPILEGEVAGTSLGVSM